MSRGQILSPPSPPPQSSAPNYTFSSSPSFSALSISPATQILSRSSTATRTLGWGLVISFQSLNSHIDSDGFENVHLEIECRDPDKSKAKALLVSEQLEGADGYINVQEETGEERVEEWVENVSSETESCRFPEYGKCFVLFEQLSVGNYMLICGW